MPVSSVTVPVRVGVLSEFGSGESGVSDIEGGTASEIVKTVEISLKVGVFKRSEVARVNWYWM